ncbi:peptidoglycan editing factor PgeF [Leptolyngbya sp. AN03gr2]|uniref:peptidoglycan editing factor PgeF n=1 Tax=unclassified Leptolyngbya TaxID=2650499 RepID=UPI003D316289
MHDWHWQTWNDLPYLTCSLLESWQHGFFTQQFSPRSPFELTEVLAPDAEAYRVHQVHGNTVLSPSELENPSDRENFSQADGLITERSQQAVWACSADCTPALIGDVKTGNVSAIHAGWRGTSQKIVPIAIAKLQVQGSHLEDLRIALGPAISGEVYQVSHPVALEVGASIDPNPTIDQLMSLPNSPILEDSTPGRSRLDVRRVIAIQLEQMGIAAEQIAIAPHCTYQDPANFFSYRRAKLKKVQWSGIVSR